jgi:hypothetical protein
MMMERLKAGWRATALGTCAPASPLNCACSLKSPALHVWLDRSRRASHPPTPFNDRFTDEPTPRLPGSHEVR